MLKIEQPIRSQVSKLTQLLTMTQTHKFPPQLDEDDEDDDDGDVVGELKHPADELAAGENLHNSRSSLMDEELMSRGNYVKLFFLK